MTLEERVDQIARELYMGEIPDLWNLLAKAIILKHMREVVEEVKDGKAVS